MSSKTPYHPIDPSDDVSRQSSVDIRDKDNLLPDPYESSNNCRAAASSSRLRIMLSWLGKFLAVVIWSALLVGFTVIAVCQAKKGTRMRGTRFLNSPLNDFIRYEAQVMDQFEWPDKKMYFTEPHPQVDQNWHDLFEHQNIGIQPELMASMGRTEEGIKLSDGTYFGSLMVFHNLHCLKNLYHDLHPEYYHLDKMTADEKAQHQEHTEHCLHMLQMAIMCQADPTLLTMKWANQGLRPIGNLTSPHECVNWDRFMEWVKPNSKNVFADGELVHPSLGLYPASQTSRPVFVNGQFAEGITTDGVV
ncbi:uncharacterized protein PG998_010364 [Apiospora kogelbergensis]|uniref:uncharacterized protein n=1 Tax=Apiospora kogelbergensis TaxID=1337665 RepID=UPI0031305311